jgi:AcrR family transcriptional regulator
MEAVTPDAAGWQTLRAWVERHGEIHRRYEPVFRAFQAAAESDEAIASGSQRIEQRTVSAVRSKLTTTGLPPRHLDAVIAVLETCMTRTRHVTGVLRSALPSGAYPDARIDDALTDVVHRTLFGADSAVNVHPGRRRAAPRVASAPADLDDAEDDDVPRSRSGARTLTNLLKAGHDLLVTRGYHGTRVDDIATAAGVSHGAFYRYFDNKDQLVRVLALRAVRHVVDAFAQIPDIATAPGPASSTALRQWLRRYHAAHASETAMIRVWVDATTHDAAMRAESAAAVDRARRRLVRFLRGRGFGDVDTEALVAVALVDAFGARRRQPAIVDATAHVIERGLLGFGSVAR